ncbi:MAG: PqqD family protein [Bradyrhizobium sp.]|uniref:PqqD family protein n=1 Tax=Bradyrhizobium sp. TaxID=376 RepID=UPI0027206EA8|nr:PqqD family protein [Bradyrhizobium sp.]MDO8400509.1 PqqD family protein [Bradyrhizobium sp.]
MPRSDQTPIQRRGFQLEKLDGETLLYRHSVKKLIYLNQSADAVWGLCDGQRTVQEIIEILVGAYPEAADIVAADVHEALDNLVREGALRMTDHPGQTQSGQNGSSAKA